jgi:predicted phage terminase large subunit-like protein
VDGDIYVVDYFRKRCNPGEVIKELFKQVKLYSPLKVGIETVAYQNTLCYWIKEQMRKRNEFFTIESVKQGRASKYTKIMGLQPIFASSSIRIRSYMTDLVTELLAFPYGKNDDIIDALAMQVGMWIATKSKAETRLDSRAEDDPMTMAYEIARAKERARDDKRDEDNSKIIMQPLWKLIPGNTDDILLNKRSIKRVG